MVSRIIPDKYADAGYSVKDTPPEINAMIFPAMVRRTPAQRMQMALETTAAARAMIWASLPEGTEQEKRAAFLLRMYGDELTEEAILTVAASIPAKTTGRRSPWTVGMTGRFERSNPEAGLRFPAHCGSITTGDHHRATPCRT